MLTRSRLAFVGCLWAFLSGTSGEAAITDFTWSPISISWGDIATYTAVDDGTGGPTPMSYLWEYQYLNAPGNSATPGSWSTAVGTANSITFNESIPGSWNVRMTVSYPRPFPVCRRRRQPLS